MFSDRWRGAKLLLVLISLAGLAWLYTDYAAHRPAGFRAAMANPAKHDGMLLHFPLWEVTKVEGPQRFYVSRTIRNVAVQGDAEGLEAGDTVSVVGNFRAQDQVVVATELHRHWLRPVKEALSTLGLLLAVFFLPRFFGWREGRLVLRG